MVVVNDISQLPITIKQISLGEINKHFLLTKSFLNEITQKGFGNGIKQETYWILNVLEPTRIRVPSSAGDYSKFLYMLKNCESKGYQLLMILLK